MKAKKTCQFHTIIIHSGADDDKIFYQVSVDDFKTKELTSGELLETLAYLTLSKNIAPAWLEPKDLFD